MDAGNMLKPALARGELRCIGSTTFQEFRSVFEKDRALARRFQKIDITEPSASETVEILRGLKERFEEAKRLMDALIEIELPALNERLRARGLPVIS